VLSYIHTIRTRDKIVSSMWDPFREMVVLLKKHGYPLDESGALAAAVAGGSDMGGRQLSAHPENYRVEYE
jgi:hypothetical protein